MRKANVLIIAIVSLSVLLLGVVVGCDPSKARREAEKKRWTSGGPEQIKQQGANENKVREQLELYKEDFGAYPQSLNELKEAGYDFPAEPSPGWRWGYSVRSEDFYQLVPLPGKKTSNSNE